MNKKTFILAARDCIGTPFHHQGRLAGVGLDCIGLVVVALRAAEREVRDRLDYGRRPDGTSIIEALLAHGFYAVKQEECGYQEKPAPRIRAGDVLVFRYDHQPQHVAIATSRETMVHAFAVAGRVVETEITDYWKRRMVGVFRD